MSDTPKMSDKAAFEQLVRSGNRTNRVNWTLSGDQSDVDALNRALRRAGGKDAPEPVGEKFPWKSLQDADKRDSGDAR